MSAPTTPAPLLGEPLPVELMNTVWADRDGVHEALGSTAEVTAWLSAVAVREDVSAEALTSWLDEAGPRAVAGLHLDLRALRDAARRLAARRTDDTRPAAQASVDAAAALRTVNQYAAGAQSWPVLDWPESGSPRRTVASEATPGSVFVADLARATVTLLSDTGDSLRACQAPGCVLYFVKQHPRREWCSAACGNRARQARHYRRHHGVQ